MEWISTQALRLSIGADAVAATLDGCKVGLTLSDVPVREDTDLATLVTEKATFAGYAKGAVTWSDPTVSDDGFVEYIGTVPEFRPTDSVTPNGIFNVWVEDAGAAILFFMSRFDNAPLPMQSVLDSIIVTLRYRPQTQMLSVVVS